VANIIEPESEPTAVASDPILECPLDGFDFSLLNSKAFKEDSVREEIILPILQALGYSASPPNKIIRSKGLEHPFLTVGSSKRPITLIPDYLLTVDNNFTFTLDAKAPGEEIKVGHNVEQVYSYAVHPEIRVEMFALCNGKEFILFEVHQKEPVIYFQVSELMECPTNRWTFKPPCRILNHAPPNPRAGRV
jgi:Type I restriction enzyme R protein N terminus (HSDR_N)